MSRTAHITATSPGDKEIWAPCAQCARETSHKALTMVSLSDESPERDIQVWHQYYVVQCQGCKTVSFCEEYQCSEDFYFDKEGEEHPSNFQKVYPGRIAGRPELDEIYDLPHGVAQIYKQTHEALCNKLLILTGIGLRAIVEAVCLERNAKGHNLLEKIDDLVAQGIITKDSAEILHSIRLMGNEAAHETKANTEEELFTAFEVVEHLLKTVYIIPRKAQKLKKAP